jgi:hypothetical protein
MSKLHFLRSEFALEGWFDQNNRSIRSITLFFFVVAVIARAIFWWLTDRTWEDALITVLHAENAVNGLGLTHFRPGEPPIHGFTSALSVLIPLVGEYIHHGAGLFSTKIVSLLCSPIAVLFAGAIAMHPRVKLPPPLVVFLTGYLALEHHQILWGMAGMETQMATAILLGSYYYLLRQKGLALGVFLGLSLLVRPDFVIWVSIALSCYLLETRSISRAITAALVAASFSAPWFVFAWLYYGSPIPNTITAKSLGYFPWWRYPEVHGFEFWASLFRMLYSHIFGPLGPRFGGNGIDGFLPIFDGGIISLIGFFFMVAGLVASATKRHRALIPVATFVCFYSLYFLFAVPQMFGWYIIPFAAMSVILMLIGLGEFARILRLSNTTLWLLSSSYLFSFAAVLPFTFRSERIIQNEIDQLRMQIGLDLNRTMMPEQTVGSESLGNIGYYSKRIVYDWPGLCNRKVVEFAKTLPEQADRNPFQMYKHFKPDYLVLRPGELRIMQDSGEWFSNEYEVIKTYKADQSKLDGLIHAENNIDKEFFLLRKRNSPSTQ